MQGSIELTFDDGAVHKSVEASGDFSHWEPIALVREEGTRYTATFFGLTPGARYFYHLTVDGRPELNPGAERVTDKAGREGHTVVASVAEPSYLQRDRSLDFSTDDEFVSAAEGDDDADYYVALARIAQSGVAAPQPVAADSDGSDTATLDGRTNRPSSIYDDSDESDHVKTARAQGTLHAETTTAADADGSALEPQDTLALAAQRARPIDPTDPAAPPSHAGDVRLASSKGSEAVTESFALRNDQYQLENTVAAEASPQKTSEDVSEGAPETAKATDDASEAARTAASDEAAAFESQQQAHVAVASEPEPKSATEPLVLAPAPESTSPNSAQSAQVETAASEDDAGEATRGAHDGALLDNVAPGTEPAVVGVLPPSEASAEPAGDVAASAVAAAVAAPAAALSAAPAPVAAATPAAAPPASATAPPARAAPAKASNAAAAAKKKKQKSKNPIKRFFRKLFGRA